MIVRYFIGNSLSVRLITAELVPRIAVPALHRIQQLQDGQNVFVKEEEMSIIILDLLVHYPNLQLKILNWFEKLFAMVYIQLMMKLYLTLLSIMVQWNQLSTTV